MRMQLQGRCPEGRCEAACGLTEHGNPMIRPTGEVPRDISHRVSLRMEGFEGRGWFLDQGRQRGSFSLFREYGAPEAANSESPLFRRHFLPQERGPEDDEQGDTTAVSDASLFRRNAAFTLRPIEPKQLASNDTRRSDQAAAAIA